MSTRITVILMFVGVIGFGVAWVGCDSSTSTNSDEIQLFESTSLLSDRNGNEIFLDNARVAVTDLMIVGGLCSAELKVTGNAEIDGEYIIKIQVGGTTESLLRCEAVVRNEHGTLFGVSYDFETTLDRFTFVEYTDADRLAITFDRLERGWVTETYDFNGETEVLRYPEMTEDEMYLVASLYREMKTGEFRDGSVLSTANPETRILMEQFERFDEFYDENNSLSDNAHGFLLVDILYNSDFQDLVKRKRDQSGQAGVKDLGIDINMEKVCDGIYIATGAKCLAGTAANPGCDLGAAASLACMITGLVFEW